MKKTKKLLVLFSMVGCLLLLMGTFNSGFAQNAKSETPVIISDIVVGDISDAEANIKWKTDKPCVSKVKYGTDESLDDTFELDSDYMVTDHNITIGDLDPNKSYSFKIFAELESGESNSGIMSFTTLIASDRLKADIQSAEGAVQIISPRAGEIVSGTVALQLKGSQVQSFERVEFSIDGQESGAANNFPFEYQIDSTTLENGSRSICADGYDIQGEKFSHCVSVLVKNGRDDASFRFVVIGDTRSGHSTHKKVLREINGLNPKPVMIFNTGDLVARGSSSSDWQKWQEATNILGINWNQDPPQYMGAFGNHDHGGNSHWKKHLVGQNNGKYGDGKTFFISYGKALFLVLNSENNTSKKWIEDTLKAQAPKHDWIFAFWHHPPYPFGSKSQDSSYRDFCPTLQKYGTKIIFVGHAHYYTRSHPINMNGNKNPKLDKENGVIQIVAGGAGAPLYTYSKNVPYKHLFNKGHKKNHYCVIDITSNIMMMEVKDQNGKIIDTLRLELKGGGDNPPTSEVREPKNNSTVNGIQNVQIRATDDKGIQKIEVFANHNLLKTFHSHPFHFDWDTTTLSNGTYTLKGVVTDTSNQSTTDSITVTVNNNGPNPDPVNQVIASDSFEEYGWKGGKGWKGAWKKTGDVKKNKLKPFKGKKYARLRAGTGRLERTVDLSRVKNPVLKFAGRVRSFEGNDQAVVKVSPNGGATYVDAMVFNSQHSDNIYHEYEIDLSKYNSKTSAFKIVFAAEMDKIKDLWYIDNIVITGSK